MILLPLEFVTKSFSLGVFGRMDAPLGALSS